MTPVEAAPFSASMPLSAPPSAAEGGDVSMPPASGALGSGLGAQGSGASGSAGSSAAAPIAVDPPPARPAVPGRGEPRKRIRLNAVTFEGVDMYHNHESDEFSFGEDFLEGFDYATEEDYDDGLEESSIPDCLKFPWSEIEPSLPPEELSQIDAVAMRFEVDRLLGIPALERTSHALPGHKHLTTRFVVTRRAKSEGGNSFWLRRARLVARDYAFLRPGRTDLFSPASSALQSKIIPAVFIANYHRGRQLVALDVADAYLNCPQVEDTCASVTINGERMWFKLLRLLPGQRDGSHKSGFISSLELCNPDATLCTSYPLTHHHPTSTTTSGG